MGGSLAILHSYMQDKLMGTREDSETNIIVMINKVYSLHAVIVILLIQNYFILGFYYGERISIFLADITTKPFVLANS